MKALNLLVREYFCDKAKNLSNFWLTHCFWPLTLDADSEAAETIKQAQSERAKGIQNLQDQLKEAKIMQDKAGITI